MRLLSPISVGESLLSMYYPVYQTFPLSLTAMPIGGEIIKRQLSHFKKMDNEMAIKLAQGLMVFFKTF